MGNDQRVPCPGCQELIHQKALECPKCGYRAELNKYHNLLSGLSVVSSILLAFTLGGSVTVVAEGLGSSILRFGTLRVKISQLVGAPWILASILLLTVLVVSEMVRHQEVGESLLVLTEKQKERMMRICERLLSMFSFALGLMAIGIIALSFSFSVYHGYGALVAVVLALFIMQRLFA